MTGYNSLMLLTISVFFCYYEGTDERDYKMMSTSCEKHVQHGDIHII